MELKPGDRVDCRIRAGTIVGPYSNYDEIRTFEIIARDPSGYYLFVPCYLHLKNSICMDNYQCKKLNIHSKFINEQFVYINESLICNVNSVLDGMICNRCKEFYNMAIANQNDNTFICFSCRNNPYR